MGRAYEVRKYSIQKTGAARGKIYTNFAKEIYIVAKPNPDIDTNISLKRLVEKAKKLEVPNDIIKRAIDKAKGNIAVDYQSVTYEGFGPGNSSLIIKALTDNVNRTVGEIRAAFNKVDCKIGVNNSVSYNYQNLGIVSFKYDDEEKVFEELLNAGIDIIDLEKENGEIIVSSNPSEFSNVKDVIEEMLPNVSFDIDEVGMYPNEKVKLNEEDKIIFDRLYNMLDEIEDVQTIYHNVED